MARPHSNELKKQQRLRKHYGDTTVSGGQVHLGDVLNTVTIEGSLHLHLKPFRKSVIDPTAALHLHDESRKSLRRLQGILIELIEKTEKRSRARQPALTKCLHQIAAEALEKIETCLGYSAQQACLARRALKHQLLQQARVSLSTDEDEILDICQEAKDRLSWIETLVSPHGSVNSTNGNCSSNEVKLVLYLPQLGLSPADMQVMLRKFSRQAAVLCMMAFYCVIRLVPTIVSWLRLPRLMGPGDTFTFYDASNLKTELPVANFQLYDNFKARLDLIFSHTPAGSLVVKGHFVLTASHVEGFIVNAQNWRQNIKEGVTIYMAANIRASKPNLLACLNPRCTGSIIASEQVSALGSQCHRCGFTKLVLPVKASTENVWEKIPANSLVSRTEPSSSHYGRRLHGGLSRSSSSKNFKLSPWEVQYRDDSARPPKPLSEQETHLQIMPEQTGSMLDMFQRFNIVGVATASINVQRDDRTEAGQKPEFSSPNTMSKHNRHARSTRSTSSSITAEVGGRAAAGMQRLRNVFRVAGDMATCDRVFGLGSLFAMLWHENVGLPRSGVYKRTPLRPESRGFLTEMDNGEIIYSHIKRFVVVRRGSGDCIALTLTSYAGKGLSNNMRADRTHNGHCIIYDQKHQPQLLANEPPFTKDAIGVAMVSDETLSVATRLCYTRPTTIDYNVKVRHIGQVVPEHLDRLLSDYRTEQLRED